jgi:hypothetical protein
MRICQHDDPTRVSKRSIYRKTKTSYHIYIKLILLGYLRKKEKERKDDENVFQKN